MHRWHSEHRCVDLIRCRVAIIARLLPGSNNGFMLLTGPYALLPELLLGPERMLPALLLLPAWLLSFVRATAMAPHLLLVVLLADSALATSQNASDTTCLLARAPCTSLATNQLEEKDDHKDDDVEDEETHGIEIVSEEKDPKQIFLDSYEEIAALNELMDAAKSLVTTLTGLIPYAPKLKHPGLCSTTRFALGCGKIKDIGDVQTPLLRGWSVH